MCKLYKKEEYWPNAPQSQTTNHELVQGEKPCFLWSSLGFEPQSKTYYQKNVWFQIHRMPANCFISHAWQVA
jgi:hypothetical protein